MQFGKLFHINIFRSNSYIYTNAILQPRQIMPCSWLHAELFYPILAHNAVCNVAKNGNKQPREGGQSISTHDTNKDASKTHYTTGDMGGQKKKSLSMS